VNEWRVCGSYFEGCNCEAICPCRSVHGRPGGPSTYGECFGALSWIVEDGHADGLDLSGLSVAGSATPKLLDRLKTTGFAEPSWSAPFAACLICKAVA
jgi:hypothetical protein